MEFSHIVTNGCSFTYCQGLRKPYEQGWPALLSDEFKTTVVNLALPGVGNDNIHRRTYEYVYKNLSITDGKPLFIIAWSQPWRRETWFKEHYVRGKPFNDYAVIGFPGDRIRNNHERALLDDWDPEDFIRRTLILKLSLINLFETHNIPYLMTNYAAQWENSELEEYISNKFPELVNAAINKNYVKDFHLITQDFSKLPCGHDDVDAQQEVSNYLVSEIKHRYPSYKFVPNKKYLKLNQFINGHKYAEKFPEWCNYVSKCDTLS